MFDIAPSSVCCKPTAKRRATACAMGHPVLPPACLCICRGNKQEPERDGALLPPPARPCREGTQLAVSQPSTSATALPLQSLGGRRKKPLRVLEMILDVVKRAGSDATSVVAETGDAHLPWHSSP